MTKALAIVRPAADQKEKEERLIERAAFEIGKLVNAGEIVKWKIAEIATTLSKEVSKECFIELERKVFEITGNHISWQRLFYHYVMVYECWVEHFENHPEDMQNFKWTYCEILVRVKDYNKRIRLFHKAQEKRWPTQRLEDEIGEEKEEDPKMEWFEILVRPKDEHYQDCMEYIERLLLKKWAISVKKLKKVKQVEEK